MTQSSDLIASVPPKLIEDMRADVFELEPENAPDSWRASASALIRRCLVAEKHLQSSALPTQFRVTPGGSIAWMMPGATLAEFSAAVKMASRALGPPCSLVAGEAQSEHDRPDIYAAWWLDNGDARHFVVVNATKPSGCKLDPRVTPTPTVYGKGIPLHPECAHVLETLKEECELLAEAKA